MAWAGSPQSSNVGVGSTAADATAAVIGDNAGDMLMAWVGNTTTTDVMRVNDSLGNQLTMLVSMTTVVAGQSLAFYAEISPGSAGNSIHALFNTNNAGSTGFANKLYLNAKTWRGGPASVSGIVDVSDQQGTNTGTTTESPVPSITTTNTGDLVMAAVFLNGGGGANSGTPTGFTAPTQNPNSTAWFLGDSYKLPAATGTFSPAFTWTNFRKYQAITFGLLPTTSVNASITQVAGTLTLTGGTQSVATVNIVAISQTSANLVLTGGTQVITTTNIIAISQVSANLVLAGGTQAIATTQLAAISQLAANLVLTGGTQAIASINNVTIAQVAANLVLTGGTQSVSATSGGASASVTQVAANLVLTGGTQAVAAVQIASISQVAGTLTLTGGTQVIATQNIVSIIQTAGSLVLTGGTQAVSTVNVVSIGQSATSLVLTGGTQAVAAIVVSSANITQVSANLVLTGGTQSISAQVDAVIAQRAANLVLTGGTQTVVGVSSATIAQAFARLILTGGTQSLTVRTGNLSYWNGSIWVSTPINVWNGSAWAVKPLEKWTGSAWVKTI